MKPSVHGQDFARMGSEKVYGIPPEQVVGTASATKYDYDKDGKPILIKEPKLTLFDHKAFAHDPLRERLRAQFVPFRTHGPSPRRYKGLVDNGSRQCKEDRSRKRPQRQF